MRHALGKGNLIKGCICFQECLSHLYGKGRRGGDGTGLSLGCISGLTTLQCFFRAASSPVD